MKIRKLLVPVILVAIGILAYWWVFPNWSHQEPGSAQIKVEIPVLSAEAEAGKAIFSQHCETCHGAYAIGTNQGPPLIHKIYEPNHHADFSFYRAVRHGVQQHHWAFGAMPAIQGVSEENTAKIVQFVREVQKANGIF